MPGGKVEAGDPADIFYSLGRPIPVVPGCTAEVSAVFEWEERKITASNEYLSHSGNGSLRLQTGGHGRYRCGGLSFLFSDAAGFFSFIRTLSDPLELTVSPKPEDDFDIPDSFNSGGEDISRLLKKQRNDELIESRQYFPGDDVRRINWKTFAHSGELFIRLGEEKPVPESRLLLIADLSGAEDSGLNKEQLDRYLDLYASNLSGLIKLLGEEGINIDLLIPPGPAAPGDAAVLAGLWWNDAGLPEGVLNGRKDNRCLLFSAAFSRNAPSICRSAISGGLRVNALILETNGPPEPEKPGLLRSLLFTGYKRSGGSERQIREKAAALAESLKPIRGVDRVFII